MKKKSIILLSTFGGLGAVVAISLGVMFTVSYPIDDVARATLQEENVIEDDGSYLVKGSSSTCLAFYPGAMVKVEAYLPLAEKLSKTGLNVYLMKMPCHYAFFDINAADRAMEKYDFSSWYVMGHSLGGAMGCSYAEKHQEKLDGVILLGSYNITSYPLEKTLTIYGELNTSCKEKITYETNVFEIPGGNHAYFGNYGEQLGDPAGLISHEQQQDATVDIINNWINK